MESYLDDVGRSEVCCSSQISTEKGHCSKVGEALSLTDRPPEEEERVGLCFEGQRVRCISLEPNLGCAVAPLTTPPKSGASLLPWGS